MKNLQLNETQDASSRRSRAMAGRERRRRAVHAILPRPSDHDLVRIRTAVAGGEVAVIGADLDAGNVSFTIGMQQLFGKPELVITGHDWDVARLILESLVGFLQDRTYRGVVETVDIEGDLKVAVMGTYDCEGAIPFFRSYYGEEKSRGRAVFLD